MRQARLAAASVAAVTLLVAVCGGCSSSKTTSSATTGSPSAASSAPASTAASASASPSASASASASSSTAASGAAAIVAVAPIGKFPGILVDSTGRTLYLFQKDTSATSTCTGACAAAWPPLTTTGTPVAAHGANQALLTTSTRSDGKTQVVYNGHPLYHFSGDSAAGDTNGEAVTAFGAMWYVVDATGNKVTG